MGKVDDINKDNSLRGGSKPSLRSVTFKIFDMGKVDDNNKDSNVRGGS